MRTDREIILSVLKLTQKGTAQRDHIAKDAHTPTDIADEVLRKLQEKNLVEVNGNNLTTAPSQRLELAIEAIKQGSDPQRTCRFLDWKEFENMAAAAFEANGYTVRRNVHFKAKDKRREIDLIACKQPRIVCVDCKHWQHGWSRATIEKTVDAQAERTKALAESLQKFTDMLGLSSWTSATLIPMVVALTTNALKIHNDTPVVPVLQLQNFISELPAQTVLLTRFSTIIKGKTRKLTEF
jgi:Holliday junction resolvase-like predicted endonuclease/predicted transcriptional regulator